MSNRKRPLLDQAEAGQWRPSEDAAGPFGGLHGGMMACALSAEMMAAACPDDAGWQPLSFHMQLLRPTPMTELRVKTGVLRSGRRMVAVEGELIADGKVTATGRALFGRQVPINGFQSTDTVRSSVLEGAEPCLFHPDFVKGRWFGDACDFRKDDDSGILWIRPQRDLYAGEGLFSRVVCLADWSTGPFKPDGFEDPVVKAFPNPDLSVHFSRWPDLIATEGFLGLKGDPDWMQEGLGTTTTELFDARGRFAVGLQSVVLS